MTEVLLTRLGKLPKDAAGDYAATSKPPADEDYYYRFLATPSKYPWGACSHAVHKCSRGEGNIFTVSPSSQAHFITDTVAIIPKDAKIVRWTLKMGENVIQNIDSWFAADVVARFKRELSPSVTGDEVTVPSPFYYTENILKALPLFMPNTPPARFEIEVIGVPEGGEVKLMNEYCSSELESHTYDLSHSLGNALSQYVPNFISIIGESPSSSQDEGNVLSVVNLNSKNKVVKCIYLRVYNDEKDDLDVVESVSIDGIINNLPISLYRKYFKNKFSKDPASLPYYVIPFCPNPKSNMPEYGEVFNGNSMMIKTSDKVAGLKVDVILETINRIIWLTKPE